MPAYFGLGLSTLDFNDHWHRLVVLHKPHHAVVRRGFTRDEKVARSMATLLSLKPELVDDDLGFTQYNISGELSELKSEVSSLKRKLCQTKL